MSDGYFAQELHLVAVYEFDKEASIAFYQSQKCYGAWCCGIWAGCLCPLCIHYSCDRANVRDEVNARHVCITHDGIKYVVDKHPSSCRLSQCDVGKVSKTVPFDKITDCDIEEPAGELSWVSATARQAPGGTLRPAGTPGSEATRQAGASPGPRGLPQLPAERWGHYPGWKDPATG